MFLPVYYTCQLSAWDEQWDEFNDVTIWVNRNTNESSYEKPKPPLFPLVPKSLVDKETCKPLSPKTIRRNEADTSSDEDSFDEDSMTSNDDESRSRDGDSKTTESIPPPMGRNAELELAEKRVLEMRMVRLGIQSKGTTRHRVT